MAVELKPVCGSAAIALVFVGPGWISLDRPTHWYRQAPFHDMVLLLAAVGVVVLAVLR